MATITPKTLEAILDHVIPRCDSTYVPAPACGLERVRCDKSPGHEGHHTATVGQTGCVWWDGGSLGEFLILDLGAIVVAVESFCRWLAQPALAQRFAVFRRRVTDLVARTPVVTAVFDCDQRRGPHVLLSCPGTLEDVGFPEGATDDQIRWQLQYWAKYLGRQYLRGNWKP